MQTPEKRSITSPQKSPSKKDIIGGYVLDVSSISKGGSVPFFTVQFQTSEESVVRMRGYNTSQHSNMLGYMENGERVKMEVRRNENNSMTFGSYCKVFKASLTEVQFNQNPALKESILTSKISRSVTVEQLKTVDPGKNSEKFTVRVIVHVGPDDLEDIVTTYGATKIKRDMMIKDASGEMNMQCFESKFKLFEDECSYEMTHMLLRQYQGQIYISPSADTIITAIDKIPGLQKVDGSVFSASDIVKVECFDSIRNVRIYYICLNCKKPMTINDPKATWIRCTNPKCENTETRVSKLTKRASAEVFFEVGESGVWATIFPEIFDKLIGEVTSEEQVDTYLKSLENVKVVLRKNVIKDIRLDDGEKQAEGEKEKKVAGESA